MAPPSDTQPDYGRRLIPRLIDEKALLEPQKTYCFVPSSSRIHDGFRAVSFRNLKKAIDACAWWIVAEIGKSNDFATIGYLGPSDLRNTIITLAAIKTGHKALLASPRNSLKAHLNLLEDTQCHVLMTAEPIPSLAKEVLANRSMTHLAVPEMEVWLDGPSIAPYPYVKSFDQARYEPFVVVHTSGSTGQPKAVVVNHGTMAANDTFNEVQQGEHSFMTFDAIRNKKCFVSAPFFHMAGLDWMLPKAAYYGIIPVLGPSGPVTAELVDEMHQQDLVEVSVVVPSILQDLAASPSKLQNLSDLSTIIYGGGPLSVSAGDAVARRTKLFNFMGCSELSNIPTEVVDREDWEYLKFSSKLGYTMRHHSGSFFELGFIRDPDLDRYQSAFATFPDRQEYFTSDLYTKHPTRPNLWKYSGRADDIMVLSNGEKLNPVDMEDLVGAHPDVRSVLVIGQARFQTALLVEAREPPLSDASQAKLIDNLWPTVEKANAQCDAHARISRDLILLASPQKPFLRAGKGTVQRKMTVESYQHEIDRLYADYERLTKPHEPDGTSVDLAHDYKSDLDAVLSNSKSPEDWLKVLICAVTGWTNLDAKADFFTIGMDSLQAINVAREINSAIHHASAPVAEIDAKKIYAYPTLAKLAKAVTDNKPLADLNSEKEEPRTTTSTCEVERMITKYTRDLPITCRTFASRSSDDDMYVLLTGSTGSIGSHLLSTLVENPRIHHVFCLNRSANGEERQRMSNKSRGLDFDWSSDQVTFYQSDPSQEYMGLDIGVYKALLSRVTHVIHNAWEVNFNLRLESFEPHLLGVRQYVDFSARSAKGSSVLFVSSVSSCMSWSLNHDGPIPENAIDDPRVSLPTGYAQSKYVSEQILNRAAEIVGIPVTICRVGQVAGPLTTKNKGGCWNKQEWLPSLVASSKYLGKLPESLGRNDRIDWIPVDVLSRVLVELMDDCISNTNQPPSPSCMANGTHASSNGNGISQMANGSNDNLASAQKLGYEQKIDSARVYHAVNPQHTNWSIILPVIEKHFGNIKLEKIPVQEWVDALSDSVKHTEDIKSNPALKLLDFFKDLGDLTKVSPIFGTVDTVRHSKELASLEAIKPEWMKLWLDQWGF